MPKTNKPSKKPPTPDSDNLFETIKKEVGQLAKEVVDQVTESPPPPPTSVDQPSPPSSLAKQENEQGDDIIPEKAQLDQVRKRLEQIRQGGLRARSILNQERQEKAQNRDPIVEGIGAEKEKTREQENDNNLPLPPPETTSRPKRGLPFWTSGQTEKRQRR